VIIRGFNIDGAVDLGDLLARFIRERNHRPGHRVIHADGQPPAARRAHRIGIGLRLGSDVTKAINDATAELIKDGTLVKIAEKYDMAASLVANQK